VVQVYDKVWNGVDVGTLPY